ncbi:hypothetical protein NBRC10513_008025 [Rhodotorula toruloides]|uniref:BY PROTMAP: gi/472581543/gb/EMS19277.1/ Prefoldin subunit [Rhodosporidium toruloides NP11] gi/647397004/emb/CDR39771.1/ RHTO0S04e09098g1_1 [Rhodosporidium toruloides] n=1 Tax=Rhodotorula toruloides TaxID=5286 RepID=A0A0K3CBI7_RHOTO
MNALLEQPHELRALEQRRDALRVLLAQLQDLADRLHGLLEARRQGNGRMQLPVDLGMGFCAEGVVEDTQRIIVAAGLENLFLDMPVEQAQEFVKKRIAIVEKKVAGLDEPIAKLKEEHAKLVNTLRSAFGEQSGQITTVA